MPKDQSSSSWPLNVAVVGTGVAGLGAAWLLSQVHRVSVFEQDERIGGHCHTVDVAGALAVDTGFIVYNERTYPNLTALFAHLGVATQASDMSFAASLDDGALEYSGSSLSSLFVQKRNLVRPRFWQMLADIRRFYRDGPQVLERPDAGTLTLGEYLDAHGYSRAFIHDHLLPMAAAIWSTPAAEMRDYPVAPFVRFCMNHGLMQVTGRPQWRTVVGGSRAYVRRLTAGFADRIRTGTAVRAIRRTAGGAVLEDVRGGLTRFDHVVIAAHADQALAMLADASAAERNVLSAFRYVANDAWLHTDAALMPKRRQCWSSWNYMSRIGDDGRAKVCVSYWMNRLQRLPATPQLFVTLNPHREPAPATVLGRFVYDHPSFDSRAIAAQAELASLQGRNHTWFCGSYFGAGFHEDALTAGLAVAETLGGVRRPWAGHGVPSSAERPWLAEAAE